MALTRKEAALVVSLVDQFSKSAATIRGEIKTLEKSLVNAGRSMQRAGTALSTALTLPLVGIGVASVKAFGEFEAAIADVSTLVDTTAESISEMRDEVLDIGSRTPVALGELSAALYDIRSAGIGADDAMEVLEGSARLAVAGLGTTKEAADLATSSINAFGLVGAEQARVYDLIFRTVKAGKTTISELARGFGGVAGTVANANVELDEYLAAVAALTTTGLPAAQAHTQIRAAIVGLTRDSSELRVVLDRLGAKNFADLVLKSGGMVNAFELISKAVGGDAAALIKLTGSAEGFAAILSLSGKQNRTYTETLAGMRSGIEAVDQAFEKQRGTVDAAFKELNNNLAAAAISLGEELAPMAVEFGKTVGGMAAAFRDLDPGLKGAIINFGLMAAALGPVLIVMGTLIRSIGLVAGAMGKLRLLLAASPGGALLTGVGLIGAGIALWSQHAGSATAAMEAHQSIVDKVGAAYGEAGRQVAAMSRAVKDGLLVEARTSMQQLIKALDKAVTEFKAKAGLFAESETFGPVVKQFLDGAIAVDKFIAEVDRLAVANPKLNHIAQALRDSAKTSLDLFKDAGETTDLMLLLTDQITDAQFEARRLAREGIAPVAVEVKQLGDVAAETTAKVEDLGQTIKVTRFAAGGPTAETFKVVDGIAQAVDASKDGLDDLVSSADAAGAEIKSTQDHVVGALRSVPEALAGEKSVGEVLTEGLDQAEVAFQGLPAVARVASDGVIAEVGRIDTALAGLGGDGGVAGFTGSLAQLQVAAGTAVDAIVASLARLGPEIAGGMASIGATANTAFQGTVAAAGAAASGIAAAFAGLAAQLRASFAAIVTAIRSQLASLESVVKTLVSRLAAELRRLQAAISSAKAKAGRSGSSDKGLALGGPVRGAGTSTSDSIPIWASHGEFMVQARAVRKYGVAFMRMINSGRLSLKALKGVMPGFKAGGLLGGADLSGLDLEGLLAGVAGALGGNIAPPRLALAGGGSLAQQRPGRPVVFNMPGGESFEMVAEEDVAKKLMRFGTGASLRSAGRKPGWYR